MFLLSRDVVGERDQSVVWLYGLKPFKVSHHTTKSGGHRHWRSGGKIVLAYYVISQGHVMKSSCNFMGRSKASYHPVKFGGNSRSGSGVIKILVCHAM